MPLIGTFTGPKRYRLTVNMNNCKPVTSTTRRWSRGLLAGPVVFVTSAVVMAGAALWLPQGAASIDNIMLPIVLFPAIWAALFFYTCLDRRLLRAWLVTIALLAGNSILIALQFVGNGGAA